MDAKTQEAMRDVSDKHCVPFYKRTTEMVRIYKKLHDRNGHQAGVRLFVRSISIRRTSEGRFIYSTQPDDFL